jgi:hypothetical protein
VPEVINIPSEKLLDQFSAFKKEDTIICICNLIIKKVVVGAYFLLSHPSLVFFY